MNQFHIQSISAAFSRVINQWLSDKAIDKINAKNATEKYQKEGLCASHEYCDPNEAMYEAFEEAMDRQPDIVNSETDKALWDAAWQLSKDNNFKNQ